MPTQQFRTWFRTKNHLPPAVVRPSVVEEEVSVHAARLAAAARSKAAKAVDVPDNEEGGGEEKEEEEEEEKDGGDDEGGGEDGGGKARRANLPRRRLTEAGRLPRSRTSRGRERSGPRRH